MVGNVVSSSVDSSIMEASGFDVLNGFIVMVVSSDGCWIKK